ncbi:MAG: OmpA family protein [Alphaproteobacteria bacterium]|nr:OmpA family protein [Alphaproteobacteria bacterium]
MWWYLLAASVRPASASDLDGEALPVSRASEGDTTTVWTAPEGTRGRVAAGLRIEAVDDPALFTAVEGTATTTWHLVDTAVSFQPHARWSVLDRMDLAASLPVYGYLRGVRADEPGVQQGGPALGDLMLAAPIRLTGEGTGLGVVPMVTLPTGNRGRSVGEGGPTGGVLGTFAVGGAGTRLQGHLGAVLRPNAFVFAQSRGPLALPVALGVTQRVTGATWLQAELRGTPALGVDLVAGELPSALPGLPFEAFVGVGGRLGSVWTTGAAARGITDGVGAARWRAALDVTWTSDRDGTVPEVVSEEPPFELVVLDDRGRPVTGAEVVVGAQIVGTTDEDGVVALDDPPRWSKGVQVRADRFLPATVTQPEDETARAVRIPLAWAPTPIAGEVRDPAGRVVDATVVATSEDHPGETVEGRLGELTLPAGTWRLTVSAEGLGTQVREVVVEPALGAPDPLEVLLLPDEGGHSGMAVVITDPEGRPVERARVLIDGVPVGTTASGGVLELAGLTAGPHQVEVLHEAFTGALVADLQTADDAVLDVPVPLQRVPGSVKVVVRDGVGRPVPDAVARFVGPRRLPPMALGERGERVQVLGAGDWQVIVTSARYGVQERSLRVPEDRYELMVVEVVLQPDEQGEAELVVRLVDPAGLPVEGASVLLDEVPYGATSSGGTLEVGHLRAGVRTLAVRMDGLRPLADRDLVLVEGRQEQVIKAEWKPGLVDVHVRGPEGPVGDARVRLFGDENVGPDDVGPSGRHRMTVPAGSWTVMVTSAEYGVQERDLVVAPDSNVRHVADFVLAPIEGGLGALAVRVVGPDERPVEGALVLLDGEERGRTANSGTLRLTDLQVGEREVQVLADPYRERTARVRLMEGERELEVALDYAPGAVKVHVHRGEEPVDDAFVRFLGEAVGSPRPVDPDGDLLARLDPGLWLVVATSASAGVAEWDLEVEDRGGLQVVDLDMAGVAVDRSDLLVQVVDTDGRPVEEAQVWIDGQAKAGDTQQGGVVLARSLTPGTVTLTVQAPDHLPSEPITVELVPGTVERIVVLRFEAVPVTVRTVDESGAPVDATVQWVGPDDVAPLVAEQGEVQTRLAPGRWRVIARSGSLSGEGTARLSLGDEPRPLEIVLHPTGAVMAGEQVVIAEQVHFDFGQATLRGDSAAILDQVAQVLIAEQDVVRVEVQGHTDDIGGVAVNQALSQARAQAVVDALVERGVPREELIAVGYGPTRPLVPNDSDEGRATNRRVQFEVGERAAR